MNRIKLRIALLTMVVQLVFSMEFNKVYGQASADFTFWSEGEWVSELTIFEGDTIVEKDRFSVERLEDKNGFLEAWEIFIGDGEYVQATVIRAFDNETDRWKLFYVDDLNAQTWDSEIMEGKVYFFKEFNYRGRKFYSRQAWSARPDGKVLRVIDRSEDGQNWTNRYWQVFSKN